MRLSFFDNLGHRFPNEMKQFFPEEPTFVEDASAHTNEFMELVQLVTIKDPKEDAVTDYLLRQKWSNDHQIRMFMRALLRTGAKTPTHLARILEGYARVFETLLPKEADAQKQHRTAIVECTFAAYQKMGFRLELAIESFLSRNILDATGVVDYLFDVSKFDLFDKPHCWPILEMAIRKTLEIQEQVLEDLEQAKRANREESISKVQKALEETREDTARLFLRVFAGLNAAYKNCDNLGGDVVEIKHMVSSRFLGVGRKYHHFIQPFVDKVEQLELHEDLRRYANVLRKFG